MINGLHTQPQAASAAARHSAPKQSRSGDDSAPPADGFQKSQRPEFEEGQLLVRLRDGLNLGGESVAEKYNATVAEDLTPPTAQLLDEDAGKLVLLQLPQGADPQEVKKQMAEDPRVAYAELNTCYYLDDPQQQGGEQPPAQEQPPSRQGLPNDLKTGLWGLNNTGQDGGKADADIDAPEAWQKHVGTRNGPVIAVIDTGIDYRHEDLNANMWRNPGEIAGDGLDNDGNGVVDDVYGYNAFANNGDPLDGHSHGTHCAGTIGAVGDNGVGVVGVNQQAQLMAVKIFSNSGSTNAAAIIRGINYATKMGARITSNSWGGGAFNQGIYDAFASSPALHIMAAGNDGTDNDKDPHYPSNYDLPNNVAVAASDRNDNRARFSCFGAETVDIAAPGKDILSTVPNNGYGVKSGTSMATPHVSGVAGLVASANPGITNDELKQRLYEGADKLENWQGIVAGGRRLNANGALSWQPPAPPSQEPPAQPPVQQPPVQQPPAQPQPPAQGQPPAEGQPPAGQA